MIYNIINYYPESVEVSDQSALRDRMLVQDFVEGELHIELRDKIESYVRKIVKEEEVSLVCFIPASTRSKTILRFGELSSHLAMALDCDVYLDVITLKADADPITHEVFFQCNPVRARGKNVLVIGGIYASKKADESISGLLPDSGASKVEELYVAKVVNQQNQ